MRRDPGWMLAAFLIAGKQAISICQPSRNRHRPTNVRYLGVKRTLVAPMTQLRRNQAARCQSITRAIHAYCSGSRRSAYGNQPRLRSAIDTSAASALSGTVKPALRRPFGVSTITRRRRRGIKLTT